MSFQTKNFWFQQKPDGFTCKFNSTSFVKSVPARLTGRELTCSPYQFPTPVGDIQYAVDVEIKADHIIIDEENDKIQLTIYKCPQSDSCSKCLSHPPEFQCGFCAKKGYKAKESQCAVYSQSHCQNSKDYQFFNSDMACPNPKISSFSPISAPQQGGSLITIRGENFAQEMGTHLAGSKCEYKRCGQDWRSQYCCLIKEHSPNLGIVQIYQMENGGTKIGDFDFDANSQDIPQPNFSIVEPKISRISPQKLVRITGQKITISGQHLDAGSSREILIKGHGENSQILRVCRVLPEFLTSNKAICEIEGREELTKEG